MKFFTQEVSNRIWERHTAFISRYAWWIVLFYVVVTCFALYYTSQNLGVNSNTTEMFDPALDFRERQDHFNELFPLIDKNFVIVVESEIPETADSVAQALAEQLRNEPDLYTAVFLPGGDPFFKKNQLLFLGEDELEDLSEKLSRSHIFLSFLAQNYSMRGLFLLLNRVTTMGNEEQVAGLGRLFGQIDNTIQARMEGRRNILSWQQVMGGELTGNPHRRIIQVKANLDFERLISSKPAIDKAHELARQFEDEYTSIGITGNLAMSYEEMKSVMDGAILGSILALFLVSSILWIGLRSLKLILYAIFTLIAGLTITMAFSAAAVGQLNLISVAFAILYIGLGVDYAIHFSLKFNKLIMSDYSPFEALRESFRDLHPALMLSTVSTAFGFYAFIPTDFKGVSELGLIAGTGMFISFIATFTLLPALLKLFYYTVTKTPAATLSAPFSRQISDFQTGHTTFFRTTAILAGIASLLLLPKIKFDYNPINLRNPDTESVAVMQQLIDSDGFTPWTVEVLTSDSASVRRYAKQLDQLPLVERTIHIFRFVPGQQDEKLPAIRRLESRYQQLPRPAKDSASYEVERQIEAIEQLNSGLGSNKKSNTEQLRELHVTLRKLLDKLSGMDREHQQMLIQQIETDLLKTFPSLIKNLKTAVKAEQITLSDLPAQLKNRWMNGHETYRIQVEPVGGLNDNQELRKFASEIREIAPEATGALITTIESGDAVVNSFIQALSYAFAVIALLIFIYLRNLRYTMYILLPLILAAIMTGAAMVLLGIQFNFANIIALPLILGLGVDNSIHIVHRFRNVSQTDQNLLNTSTARAVFFSSLTTLFSFGSLAFSPHRGTASMGIILTLGLLLMLFVTLIVLPAFLITKKE